MSVSRFVYKDRQTEATAMCFSYFYLHHIGDHSLYLSLCSFSPNKGLFLLSREGLSLEQLWMLMAFIRSSISIHNCRMSQARQDLCNRSGFVKGDLLSQVFPALSVLIIKKLSLDKHSERGKGGHCLINKGPFFLGCITGIVFFSFHLITSHPISELRPQFFLSQRL